MNNKTHSSSPTPSSSNSLSLQINLKNQTTSLSLLNLTHDLVENTAFKNERKKYFTDASINKFAKDCFLNTTKHQKDKLRLLMEDVLIEQQKGFYESLNELDEKNSTVKDEQRESECHTKTSIQTRDHNNNKMQLVTIESSSKSIFENSLAKLSNSIENGESNDTENHKASSSKLSTNVQNLFKYYLRRKSVKKASLQKSLNKKLKENVKLKNEIIDLLENATNSNHSANRSLIEENNNLNTEQKKVLIDELDKKENFLSANINRNILALEDFMKSNENSMSVEKKTNLQSSLHESENLVQNCNKIKRFNFYKSKNREKSNEDFIEQKIQKNSHVTKEQSIILKDSPSFHKKLILIEKPSVEPKKYIRGKYLCVECGAKKSKLSELKQHLFTHENLRPFICYHCDISFKTKGNLVKHVKTKAHLNRCIEIGMNADDEQVVQVTADNVDEQILSKQMLIEKPVLILNSNLASNHNLL